VSIASPHGKFGQLYLARYLHERGALSAVIDTRPWRHVKQEKAWLPREKYVSMPCLEYGRQLRYRMGHWFPVSGNRMDGLERLVYSKWLPCALPDGDNLRVLFSCGAREALKASRREGVPTILFNNSTHIDNALSVLGNLRERDGKPRKIVDRWHRDMIAEEYELADYIRVPSESARRTFLERGVPASKVRCVPHGYEIEFFRPHPKKDDVFRVLFFGSIGYRKGVPELFEAFERAKIPNSELVLVGSVLPEIRDFLSRTAVPHRILGFLGWKDLAPVVSQASVSVLLSWEEGSAGTIGQAMACGVPVIVSEGSGAEPVVREGVEGFLVPNGDSAATAERLRALAADPGLRDRMGAAAAVRAREYSWENHGELVWRWILEILSSRTAGGRP
jgi:glycosyltransferase involved in cell wall biosynthesis